jgi:hypothetical protein
LGSASWTVWLPVNKEGRFPSVDDNVRSESAATSQLNLATADADFLLPRFDSLPADQEFNNPITLDLNGRVTLRAWAEEQRRPLELLLSNSAAKGEPVSVCMNRQYLARALRLGFRRLSVFGREAPVQCDDATRTYLWMSLDGPATPSRVAEPVRIESPRAGDQKPPAHRVEKPVTARITSAERRTGPQGERAATALPRLADSPSKSSVEQAIALRDALRSAVREANELIRSVKLQKRRTRLVENTLSSLKQLQKVAG